MKEAPKKSGLARGVSSGFSIIELLIVLAVIGLIAAAFGPQLVRSPRASREAFLSELNSLVRNAQQQALLDRELHRVTFALEQEQVRIEHSVQKPGRPEPVYEPIEGFLTEMSWPSRYEIRSFKVGAKEQAGGGELKNVWFFVNANGMVQETQLSIFDTEDNRLIHIQIDPFTAQFEVEYAAAA